MNRNLQVDPVRDLCADLLGVEKPGRYTGGEYGSVDGNRPCEYRVAVCFPDLYEIGMSNLAVRILYQLINRIPGVLCERVFAPAPDFEALITEKKIPLYGLESGTPLHRFDLVGFSVGYELSATNVLTILERGGIPIDRLDRTEGDPIVLGGGPALTNPTPFGRFLDVVFIGEAEGVIPSLVRELSELKKAGARRQDLLERLTGHRSVWAAGKSGGASRAVWNDFGKERLGALLPVPGIKTAQDHGVIEIMRGCPNGCRFCHAGIFYRPFREKSPDVIAAEADSLVRDCGYREITVSSLSSGDYSGIVPLVEGLNDRFGERRVSFSLPSLRVDSFTLPLIERISEVRKSGLTFAVETPVPEWQRALNKEVTFDKTLEIMLEAKKRGWRLAKFYFMIGLPSAGGKSETEAIVTFLKEIQAASGMSLNVNVGTFVPKPHTPFQWSRQLTVDESFEALGRLKAELRRLPIHLKYNSPFSSFLEGVITRGDERVGDLVLQAYRSGARLDAWEEHLNRDVWNRVLRNAGWDVERETCRERAVDELLPWDGIRIGTTKAYLREERERALSGRPSSPCEHDCSRPCGVCGRGVGVQRHDAAPRRPGVEAESRPANPPPERRPPAVGAARPLAYLTFSFSKNDRAVFLSHLNVMLVFERALLRAGVPARYTEGFNPKPRLEFAHPLSLGISSDDEVARVYVDEAIPPPQFIERVNRVLHAGLTVRSARLGTCEDGRKPTSLMAAYWGSDYLVTPVDIGDTRHTVADLMQQISEQAAAGGIADHLSVRAHIDGVHARVQQGPKEASIVRLLAAAYPDDWQRRVRIRRVRTLTVDRTGSAAPFLPDQPSS